MNVQIGRYFMNEDGVGIGTKEGGESRDVNLASLGAKELRGI